MDMQVSDATGAETVSTSNTSETPTVEYTLKTDSGHDGLAFMGVGGTIDGQKNPTLTAKPGDVVKLTIINGDGVMHDLTIDEFKISTGTMEQKEQKKELVFKVDVAGEYVYYCAVPGHRQAGMWGTLQVGDAAVAASGADIVRPPSDLPGPIGARAPETVRIDLEAQEIVGQLADGTTFPYMTYNGKVPGPFLRVKVGDTVEMHLKNSTSSAFTHSIDLHAATGPGGGAVYSQVNPGEEKVFTFKALQPGVYVYHCATPSIPHHIASGMYGLILVELQDGLPKVDKEFYVMQGEIYSDKPFGTKGVLAFDDTKLANETPDYLVFNGAVGSLALAGDQYALRANVGDTVRIYFGDAGPNKTSSFHLIGEIFDKVYPFASLTSPALTDVQTVTVPAGGATVVEFKLDVPGKYALVDHALSRLERGLVGLVIADGPDNPDIFHDGPAAK
jgi:nitrite reductase (NO-forming)